MTKPTIWHRLNTCQFILVGLLLVGVGLALWMERFHAGSERHIAFLESRTLRIRIDLAQLSNLVRGQLLDPRGRLDPRTTREPEDDPAHFDLIEIAAELEREFGHNSELLLALRNLMTFHRNIMNPFWKNTLSRLAGDAPGAAAYYLENHPSVREQQEKFLSQLLQQVQAVEKDESFRNRTVSVIGLVLILAVLASVFLIGRLQSSAVAKPLEQLVAALERMRQGDLSQRVKLPRQDEFGVLAENFNLLAENLSSLVGQVKRSGLQVNTTATEIAATAREQQTTAVQIATTATEIGGAAKRISATSKELNLTMDEVSEVAEETAGLATNGQTGIARMENTMRQIMESSGVITAKLAVLSEKTSNINSVVTTISRVADQTNLLSLNAAIEAEKAGEYGLGFAVVAMEIRRLADQTAVATYDIEKMVKEMQSAVASGVMGMDKFSEEVRRGVEEIRQVSTQLAQIIREVQTLTPRFQAVNEGMHAQSTGAAQISETLSQLGAAAQQTAESLRQSNLAIAQLNEAARGLQTGVSRFKLETS